MTIILISIFWAVLGAVIALTASRLRHGVADFHRQLEVLARRAEDAKTEEQLRFVECDLQRLVKVRAWHRHLALRAQTVQAYIDGRREVFRYRRANP